MGGAAAPVDEVVGFLQQFAPGALTALQAKHPGHRDVLEPGQLAGTTADDAGLRLEVALVGLDEALNVSTSVLATVRARLARAQTWSFLGQLLSLIGGASVLATLALDAAKLATYGAGILALLGSAATLFSQHLDGTLHPALGKLVDTYRELADQRVEAAQVRTLLKVAMATGRSAEALESVPRANDLCLQMGKLMNRVL